MKNGNMGVKVAVVVGLVVEAVVKAFRDNAGVRTAAMVDLNGGDWGRLHVSECGSLDRGERDQMLAALNVGDKVRVKVLSVEPNGRRPKVEVSAKVLVQEQKAQEQKANAGRQLAARAALTVGTLLTGKVTRLQPFGAFVAVDEFHTGLLHNDEQLPKAARPQDLKVGDSVRCVVIREVTGSGRDMKIALSEKAAASAAKQQAKAGAANALRAKLAVGQQYAAVTVADLGKTVGLTVEIERLVPAALPNANLLDVTKRASAAGKGQPVTVEVVAIDGDNVTVKQVKKGKKASS